MTLGVSTYMSSKTCVQRPLSNRPKIGFQDQLSLNAGQKYSRMRIALEHSAIFLTFIKLPFVINIFVLYILSGRFIRFYSIIVLFIAYAKYHSLTGQGPIIMM